MKLTVLRIDMVTTTVNCCMCFEYDVMKRKSYSHFILLVPPFWQISRLDHQNVFFIFLTNFLTIYLYMNVMKLCVAELGLDRPQRN